VPDVPLLITPGEGSDDAKRITTRQATPSRDEKAAGSRNRSDLWKRREESRRTSKSRSPSAQPVTAIADGGSREKPADSRPTLQIPNGRPRTPKARFEEDSQDDEVDLIKEGGSAVRSLPADSSRQADLLSSPGSTAQSATTPAGHEASTDTSPDTGQEHDEDISEAKDSADGDVGRRDLGLDAEVIAGSADKSTSRPGEDTTESATMPEGDSWPTRADAKVRSSLDVAIPEKQVGILRLEGSSLPPSSRAEDGDGGAAVTEEVSHGLPSATRLGEDVDEEMTDRPVTDHTTAADPVPDDSDVRVTAMNAERGSPNESRPLTTESQFLNSGEQQLDLNHAALQVLNHRARDGKRTAKVVFGSRKAASDQTAMVPTAPYDLGNLPNDDYFVPLFVQGFAQSSKWMKVIEALLSHAHKTVSTEDQYLALLDNQACRLLRRVYQLQQHDKWSFRQPARCPEPARPTSHWDLLLQEAKWMRTDFREERKWKRAAARNMAYACAEWVESSPAQRKSLQVNTVLPLKEDASQQIAEDDAEAAGQPQTEESISDEQLAVPEEAVEELPLTVAPSAIFALQNDNVVFGLNHTPSSDKLLAELPTYGAPLVVPRLYQNETQLDPDAAWKRPALPLSKYINGHLTLKPSTPPMKRSRYQYMLEDEEDAEEFSADGEPLAGAPSDVVNTTVALFSPEMKGLRDRLYTGHQFRPPTESPMPLQSFYEWRMPSQWTWAEDDELKQLVRDYQYNWSLISSMLAFKTIFATGGERRTPWECFERWVNLEGLPSEMSKQPYFKMWHNRIDAGQRMVQQQYQNLQQQPNAAAVAASLTAVARRRQSIPLRVDKRRASKHFAIMDAMRKVAKRRETALQKQQQTASHAASRKANETQQQHGPTKTPRDYSLMRFERDQQLAEKMAQFAQRQQEAQRRVSALVD
jgi:chromatin modification-related protein VID21